MGLCPNCEKEVTYIGVEENHAYGLRLEDGKPVHDTDLLATWQEPGFATYECPYCGETLAETEEEAVQFLTGERVLPVKPKQQWPMSVRSYSSRKKQTDQMALAL